jgi:putative membrane protein
MLLVEPVRELIRYIPMLLVLLIAGSGSDSGPPWSLIGAVAVIALGIARYLSTRFRITPAVVEVRRGILQRKHLTVPRDRIRTLDVSAHPLQRLLGLVRVDVGTGSSHPHAPSVRLDGLRASAVPALRTELLHHATGPPPDLTLRGASHSATTSVDSAEPAEVELARLRPSWIALAPATLSGVVTGAVLIGFGFRLLREARLDPTEFGPIQRAMGYLRGHSVWLDVGLAVAAVALAVVILSVAGYVLSFWGFRLTRHPGGTLQVSRGLLTTRSTSVSEHRLRGVQRREPLVLRWARGARLQAVATGLRREGGGEGGSSLLMPPAPAADVLRVQTAILGDQRLVRGSLQPHGTAARRRRYTRSLAGAAAALAALAALTWWVGLPAPLYPLWVVAVRGGSLPLAADRYRNLGHAVVDGHLVVGFGSLHRRRTVLAVDGVIGVTIRQSIFQRRAGVATLIATTAAGHSTTTCRTCPSRRRSNWRAPWSRRAAR